MKMVFPTGDDQVHAKPAARPFHRETVARDCSQLKMPVKVRRHAFTLLSLDGCGTGLVVLQTQDSCKKHQGRLCKLAPPN